MKLNKDLIVSFAIYGLGLLCVLLADLHVSSNFSDFKVAEWAFIKSTVLIVGTFCLLGYDQIFIRDQSLIKRFYLKFLFQSCIIAILLIVLLMCVKGYIFKNAALISICVLLLAVLSYFSSASRANFHLWKSQFSTNFWKIILLFGLYLFEGVDAVYYFLFALAIGTAISIPLKGFIPNPENETCVKLSDKEAIAISSAFLLHNMTLIFAIYGEQFIINLSNDVEASSHLFKYTAVFTPIALSLNGFLGFYFAPKVRKDNNMSIPRYWKFSKNILLYSVLVTIFSAFAGILYMIFYINIPVGDLDIFLILSLSFMCITRGLYITTSVCLGVFGDAKDLRSAAVITGTCTLFYLISIFIILLYFKGITAAWFISLATLGNWLLRLIISNKFTFKTLKRLQYA
ncbi:MAG TPA: hypothetical protein VNQ80_09390 [Parapedobacter sp.]|uniref:hypothetical protein n=1 Tax=Parapedobacter sp. TaxID=1958893 RepID=UPI002B608E61|nr:hypothetical protein [Parapedobacter sp.]HWK57540.1 hypothetical protein [Parapedobacter sp.]